MKKNKKVEVIKPDIRNYANIDIYNAVSFERNDLPFWDAISIVRDNQIYSEDMWRKAFARLASTYGTGRRKLHDNKLLDDFNKTQKLLSFYGRRIQKGNYKKEDLLIYEALLYHFAKLNDGEIDINRVEDWANDYIADEAERYVGDIKVLKK